MAIDKDQIIHRTERAPGLFRNEIYELDDIKYTQTFDDETGERLMGHIDRYGGIRVCSVGADGTLCLNYPTGWVTSRKEMTALQADLKQFDEFLAAVVENYH